MSKHYWQQCIKLFNLGQGSQYVGMGKDLYNLYPRSAKLVFDEADEALGTGLRALIFEGQQVIKCG